MNGSFDCERVGTGLVPSSRPNGTFASGHMCAVNAATLAFVGVVGWVASRDLDLNLLGILLYSICAGIIFWIICFSASALPAGAAYAIARFFRIRSIFYYLVWGALTGAALAPIFVWFESRPLSPPFLDFYLDVAPRFMAIGALAAAVFWYKTGRHVGSESTAQ
jgi:hypothetical protein